MSTGKDLLLARCRKLRKNASDAEQLLWIVLRNRQIANAKFRRQFPLLNFILDFYSPDVKLAIEVDGGQHLDQAEYDHERTRLPKQRGILVLRFWNDEVLTKLEAVINVIGEVVQERQRRI